MQIYIACPKCATVAGVVPKKRVVVHRRVALVDAFFGSAFALRPVARIFADGHAWNKYDGLFAVGKAGCEGGECRQGEDKSYFFHVGLGFGG